MLNRSYFKNYCNTGNTEYVGGHSLYDHRQHYQAHKVILIARSFMLLFWLHKEVSTPPCWYCTFYAGQSGSKLVQYSHPKCTASKKLENTIVSIHLFLSCKILEEN